MKNETKGALAIGLLIIIGFGFVLIQVKGPPAESALRPAKATGGEFTTRALESDADETLLEKSRLPAPRRRFPAPRPPRNVVRTSTPPGHRPPGPARAPVRTYTVQPKDSLTRIARRVYGSGEPKYYKLIFAANKGKLRDIATVRPGQVLKIPAPPDGWPVRSAWFNGASGRRWVAVRGGGTR